MGAGTFNLLIIVIVFFFLAGMKYSSSKKAKNDKPNVEDVKDDEIIKGFPALTATRDSFFEPAIESAPVPKLKPALSQKNVGPSGATRVAPEVIDYSMFDEPTCFRRGLKVGFA